MDPGGCARILVLLLLVAEARGRDGYCPHPPVPPGGPSGRGCSECHADADCPSGKKCCGSPCGNTCQSPEPNLCKLPAVTGPCKARLEVFFFNWATRRCEIFIYGGCYGNLNQFGSERECLRICGAYATAPSSEDASRARRAE